MAIKKWRCTVCNYIHEGDRPPETCPICGVGSEKFVPVEEKETDSTLLKEIKKVCYDISYGVYIICSKNANQINGQAANSIMQITSDPVQLVIGINKNNLTHEYIGKSGVFTASILGRDGIGLAKHFGFQTGREVDKFKEVAYELGPKTSVPYIKGALSYLECKVDWEKTVDAGSHTLYFAKVIGGGTLGKGEPMTYSYYHANRK